MATFLTIYGTPAVGADISLEDLGFLESDTNLVADLENFNAPPPFQPSTTAWTGQQSANSSIRSVGDLTAYAPNFAVGDANGDRMQRYSIRGLRENNFGAGESVLGLYIDDIPFTDLTARDALLYDVEQIEIQRGARGTRFGAARPGGMIRIVTQQPDNVWRGAANISYGTFKAASIDGRASGPIMEDKLYFAVSGIYGQRDGFAENVFDDSNPDDRQTLAARVQLRYEPNELWDLSFIAAGNRYRDGFIPTALLDASDPYTVARDFNGQANTDAYNIAFKAGYDRERWRGLSVTSYRDWKQDIEQDFDFSPQPIRLGFNKPDIQEISQEFRFLSNDLDDPIQWTGGAFFSGKEFDGNSGTIELQPLGNLPGVPPPIVNRTDYTHENRNFALFGELAYTFLEEFEITGGLRWDHDRRSMNRQHLYDTSTGDVPIAPPVDVSDSWNSLQPRVQFSWMANDTTTAYASATKGYQSGGFNPVSDVPNQVQYDSSDSWTLELGSSSSLLQNKLTVGGALFYTDTSDYQVFRPTDPFGNYALLNAQRVDAVGAEVELNYEPVERLNFNVGFGYTHAKFREFTDPAIGIDFSGSDVNFVPQFTSLIGVDYKFDFGLFIRVETQIVGRQYWDEANTELQNAYVLLNGRIGYEYKQFGIYAWARNLTDTVYFNNALDFGADFGGAFYGTPGNPATFGVSVRGRF